MDNPVYRLTQARARIVNVCGAMNYVAALAANNEPGVAHPSDLASLLDVMTAHLDRANDQIGLSLDQFSGK